MNGATPYLNLTYGYDLTGSITGINNGTYTETFGYDLLDRLNSTVGPWGSISYGYDAVGNRLSRSMQGGGTTSYTYDNMDRLVSATGLGFNWDSNGNIVCKHDGVDAWNYTYDPLNRLIRVRKMVSCLLFTHMMLMDGVSGRGTVLTTPLTTFIAASTS